MDILSPQLMWIGNRCYRVNSIFDQDDLAGSKNSGYVEEDLYDEDCEEEEFEIETTDNDRYKTTFHVPKFFFAQIIGTKGATKKRIEAETKTQIRIPKQGLDGDIIIIGSTRQSVCASRRKVNLIVLAARNKQQFTHFLSIPFTSKEITDNFIKFKNDILSGPEIFGLESSLFQNPKKLHLTIGTMSLMDNEDRALAAQILQNCRESIMKPILNKYGPLELELRGLEYMNDEPSAVDVLYGKVESEPLQLMANLIQDYFIEKGLMQRKTDTVKLHVTLINSLFRAETSEENEQNKRITFDARSILETYKNFYFGKQQLNEVHLSQRYSTSYEGFYEATGIIKL